MKRFTKVCLILGLCLLLLGAILAGTAWSIGIGKTDGAVERKELTLEAGEISELEVSLTSEDVYVYPSKDDLIHIYYTEDERNTYILDVEQQAGKGTQTASFYRKNQRNVWFGFDFLDVDYDVTIELPESMDAGLLVNLTSGELKLEQVQLGTVDVNGTSGDVTITRVSAQKVDVGTVSGSVTVETCEISERLQANTTSGEISLNRVETLTEPGTVDVSTTSGEIQLEDCRILGSLLAESTSGDVDSEDTVIQGSIDITTVSGEVALELPQRLYQTAPRINTVSGTVETDDFSYGTNSFTVSTTSGDVTIRRNKD